jgi:hypothetical protein
MSDLERLQGTWDVAALEVDGAEQAFDGATITVDGTSFTSASPRGDARSRGFTTKQNTGRALHARHTARPHRLRESIGKTEREITRPDL